MNIIESFWINRLGFIKVNNGFETRVFAGIATAPTQQEAEKEIVGLGLEVPQAHLVNFLQIDNFGKEYTQEN